MNEEQQRDRRVRDAVAQGRSLVRDARLLVERTRRRLDEWGIDPEAEYERLKAEGGEAAVLKAQKEFQHLLDGIEAEMQRDALHAKPSGLAPVRRRFNPV